MKLKQATKASLVASLNVPCMCIFYEAHKNWCQCLENSSDGHSSTDMYKKVWQLVNQVGHNSSQDAKGLLRVLLKKYNRQQ